MMDNTDAIIKELHEEAEELLALNNSDEFIIHALMQKGIDKHYAEMVLENARSDQSDRKEFSKLLFGGIFTFLTGVILTFGTYSLTVPGGIYFVFWGMMVYGVYLITRGVILFRK
jgi:hypothetical protein